MRIPLVSALAGLVLLGTASAVWALQTPGRTIRRDGPITAIGLTHAAVAIAVGRTATDCDHVELWNADTRGTWRFGPRRPCGDVPLLEGIAGVDVASSRVVWISYAGGNLTDWQLWTATPTRPTSRQLRFVERETGDPAPMVVGEGTQQAVPYALENTVTWLAGDGAPCSRGRHPPRCAS